MGTLVDQIVVITGASSGIGRATAYEAARKGATLALVARGPERLEQVAEECRDLGATAVSVHAVDVADAEAITRVAGDVAGSHGRIDTWVNNAAVHMFGALEQPPVEDWHRVVEVNLFGTYHGMRAALGWMREQGRGTIVNVSSVLGRVGAPYQSAYVASKHAIRALSESARQELAELPDLHVCTVLPGPIDTPLFDHAANHSGRAIKPVSPVIDARRVAAAVLRCATHPRAEVAVGASSKAAALGARFAPRLAERVSRRQNEQHHFAPAPAPATSGNLAAPVPGAGGLSGGWTRSGERAEDGRGVSEADSSRAGLVLVAATALAAIGTLGIIGARRRGG